MTELTLAHCKIWVTQEGNSLQTVVAEVVLHSQALAIG